MGSSPKMEQRAESVTNQVQTAGDLTYIDNLQIVQLPLISSF